MRVARHLSLLLAGLALAGPPPAAAATPPLSVQEALLRAKPAVALIVAEVSASVRARCGPREVQATARVHSATGTGWFLAADGRLITNGHVVQPAYRPSEAQRRTWTRQAVETACLPLLLQAQGLPRGKRPDVEERLRRQIQDASVPTATVTFAPTLSVVLSTSSRLPAEVKKYSPPFTEGAGKAGRDLALLQVPGKDYPTLPLAGGPPVQIGDPLHILGFPGVVLSHELLNQSASVEASVTNGAISGFKEDVANQPVIQTDAPAAWGNSGGPAVNRHGEVVGVLTFVTLAPGPEGGIVQGFNFVIPAAAVQAFLQDTGVVPNAGGRFNAAWWAGLRAFFADDFRTAQARLTEANGILPNLPDVKRMLAEAQDKLAHPPPRPFPWAWVALGVTLASGSGFGGLWARRWWRNRFRMSAGQVIALLEGGRKPVFVDCRSGSDFEASPLKLPGAVRLAPEEVEAGRLDLQVDPQQTIVTYCSSPEEQTSARATHLLRGRGYRHVRILRGGLGGWTNAGLPVEAKSHLPSVGLEIYRSLSLGDLERRRFAPGQAIFLQGDDAKGEAFIVHSGKVDISQRSEGAERVLRTFGEGELLGEMALFRKAPRSASALAATEVELLVIRTEQLDWLIRNRPQLTLEILKRLSDWVATAVKAATASGGPRRA
jgi:rhodanese-related sulfurtransferase